MGAFSSHARRARAQSRGGGRVADGSSRRRSCGPSGEAMAGTAARRRALARAVDICFVRFELGALCGLRARRRTTPSASWPRTARPRGLAAQAREGHRRGPPRALRRARRTFATLKRVLEKTGVSLPGDPAGDGQALDDVRATLPREEAARRARRRRARRATVRARRSARRGSPSPTRSRSPSARRTTSSASSRSKPRSGSSSTTSRSSSRASTRRPGATSFVNARRSTASSASRRRSAGLPRDRGPPRRRPSSGRPARPRATEPRAGVATGWQDRRYRHDDGRVLTLRESVYPVSTRRARCTPSRSSPTTSRPRSSAQAAHAVRPSRVARRARGGRRPRDQQPRRVHQPRDAGR